jgi:hypothetical protein
MPRGNIGVNKEKVKENKRKQKGVCIATTIYFIDFV